MSQPHFPCAHRTSPCQRFDGASPWLGGLLALMIWGSGIPTSNAQRTTPPSHAPVTTQSTAIPGSVGGVAVSDLAPDAPSRYTVKPGDTLWSLATVYLRAPWRWPALWGMNKAEVRNPHRIFPGQVLVLDTSNGQVRLGFDGAIPTVKVTPRVRSEPLSEASIPPVPMSIIGPFLTDAMIVDEHEFAIAPRIVAAQEGRVLLSKGDRAYARSLYGVQGEGGLTMNKGDPLRFRVFRNVTPLKDPVSREVLGFEAQYVGRAVLVRPESIQEVEYDDTTSGWGRFWGRWGWGQGDGTGAHHTPSTAVTNEFDATSRERVQGGDQGVWTAQAPVTRAEMPSLRSSDERKVHIELQPATIDITDTKEEIRPGDRLVPEPVREFVSFVPRSPDVPQDGQIISVHGNAVTHAGQNQVVVINRGQDQGLLPGHVLQIWKDGILAQDKTDPDRPFLRLPKERNGLMIVFRSFNKLSYALVLQITDGVRIGDRFSNP